jgi:NADH:ubiquinone oxidoreductase subunit 3 (subunit A)
VLGPLGAALTVFVASIGLALALRALGQVGDTTAPERLPFAGGYPPRVHALSRFHARYYVMAFVFVAFDMEMVYMYPWAVVFVREGAIAFVEMAWFILVLLLGILYAWREGAFEWA